MDVQAELKKCAIEYVKGEKSLADCSVPGIKWSALRRALIFTKKYYSAKIKDRAAGSSMLLEKKRAESRFWLETGHKWPSIDGEI